MQNKLTPINSLYVHIPYCVSKCNYCDFFSIPIKKVSVPEEYVQTLCNEIKYNLKKYKVNELRTIYIGGGTPSLLNQNQLKQIFDVIVNSVSVSKNSEITIEVNPDDVNQQLLDFYSSIGINRISCGIQSLNDESLCESGRRARTKENLEALNFFSKWENTLSLDLICGLPYETEETFLSGLERVIEANPEHISMYSLTIEDNTPFGKMYLNGKLNIDYEYSDALWIKATEFLEKKGYKQYEVSNFCKKGFECKHNLVYWNHQNYLGCGCGATGTIYNLDGSGIRLTNRNDLDAYIKYWKNPENTEIDISLFQLKEDISVDISIFEFFMMGLRKLNGITDLEFESVFGRKIPESILNVFNEWNNKNLCLIESEEGGIRYSLGKKGILFLNKFLEEII